MKTVEPSIYPVRVGDRFQERTWKDSFGCTLEPSDYFCMTCGVSIPSLEGRLIHNQWHNRIETGPPVDQDWRTATGEDLDRCALLTVGRRLTFTGGLLESDAGLRERIRTFLYGNVR